MGDKYLGEFRQNDKEMAKELIILGQWRQIRRGYQKQIKMAKELILGQMETNT